MLHQYHERREEISRFPFSPYNYYCPQTLHLCSFPPWLEFQLCQIRLGPKKNEKKKRKKLASKHRGNWTECRNTLQKSVMMGSCYSGAPINYSSAHQQHSHQKKRSFKTNNLSKKKIPDSKEKTKKKKISISEEGHTVVKNRRSDGRTEKQATLRSGATKPRFMALLLLGPRSRPTHMYTLAW